MKSCCQHSELKKSNNLPKTIDNKVIYTCPMHPEIRRVKMGNCLIYGMALELEVAKNNNHFDKELSDLMCRFAVALILTLPILLMAWLLRFQF